MLFAIILYEFFVLHALKTTAVIKHEENRISSASYIPSFASPREVDDVVICLLILRVCVLGEYSHFNFIQHHALYCKNK